MIEMLMKKVMVKNRLVIREKREDQVPKELPLERRYVVFAPDGRCLEDNLTYDEAFSFCEETKDFVEKGELNG